MSTFKIKDCTGNCTKYKSELKKLYKLASKLTGVYKNLYEDTSRFTIGLLNTDNYDKGLELCEGIKELLETTEVYD